MRRHAGGTNGEKALEMRRFFFRGRAGSYFLAWLVRCPRAGSRKACARAAPDPDPRPL